MRIVFCADPLDAHQLDPTYTLEVSAASALGIPHEVAQSGPAVRDRLAAVQVGTRAAS